MMRSVKLTDIDITRTRGLNNRADPMGLGLSWLTVAQNIDVTSEDKPVRRDGYTLRTAGTIGGAYSTRGFERMYYLDAGVLKDGSGAALASGITGPGRMYWCEVNEQVYFNNGDQDGIITQDNRVLPWSWQTPASPAISIVTGGLPPGQYRVICTHRLADGRETGPSDEVGIEVGAGEALQISAIPLLAGATTLTYIAPAHSQVFQLALSSATATALVWSNSPDSLGVECPTIGMDALPVGSTVVQMWGGRAWAAVYDPARGITYLFQSQPLGFHLFDLEDYSVISGEVLMLAPHDQGLVIGTRTMIAAIDAQGTLTVLAPYGVVPGWCWDFDEDDSILMWTARGLCRALPFTNLTGGHHSVAPGVQAGAAVISTNGQRKFVACLHEGGTAFNARN